MISKRALVVDDSKSARAFLSRILERHEIEVDSAESAEAAIEYLARNKPDVIFMDHLMPGMDGFQAVQTIKNNPRTSAIPILMYTSQEGDLYLGQARALGADGVLPKQIKQSDVTKMLFQLRLVADRRGPGEQSAFARVAPAPELVPANESAIVVPASVPTIAPAAEAAGVQPDVVALLPQLSLEIRAALDQSLQKEFAELRGHLHTTLEAHAERLHGDLAALAPARQHPDLDLPTLVAERRPWGAISGWTLALAAIAGAAVMSWLWWEQGTQIAGLRTDLAAAYAEVESLRAAPAVVSPAATADSQAAVTPAADAPDAAVASTAAVQLVPGNAALPVAPAIEPATAPAPAPAAALPATPPPASNQAQ